MDTATTATTTTRTIEIDGMTGDACVQKVGGALRGVPGVTTQTVKVGSATFDADQTAYNAARAAIGSAGYRNRESGVKTPARAAAPSPNGAPAASKPADAAQMSPRDEGKASQPAPAAGKPVVAVENKPVVAVAAAGCTAAATPACVPAAAPSGT